MHRHKNIHVPARIHMHTNTHTHTDRQLMTLIGIMTIYGPKHKHDLSSALRSFMVMTSTRRRSEMETLKFLKDGVVSRNARANFIGVSRRAMINFASIVSASVHAL